MQPLPIDPLLAEIASTLETARALVLEAPPGAGKTTRVPPALLAAGIAGSGEIVVAEPRRLAARLAARRVAEERGERVGQSVGYSVRFEDVSSDRTRIRFVTEGVLVRRLLDDPELAGVGRWCSTSFTSATSPPICRSRCSPGSPSAARSSRWS